MEIKATDINTILLTARSLSDDGEMQLTTLFLAVVVACKSAGVDKKRAIASLKNAFKQNIQTVTLEERKPH